MSYSTLVDTRKQIRLLHLKSAASKKEEIKCRFTTALLDDNEEHDYEALSYVWGTSEASCLITIESIGPRNITPNLYSALQHLRSLNGERTLWIDALCIDQENNTERENQVSQMGKIYKQASRVIVWLGEGWDGSELAIQHFIWLGQTSHFHLDDDLTTPLKLDGPRLDYLLEQLVRLLQVPWWKRTWTVQEFVLARELDLQCGDHTLSRRVLFQARDNVATHGYDCCHRILTTVEQRVPNLTLDLRDCLSTIGSLKNVIDGIENETYSVLHAFSRFHGHKVGVHIQDKIFGMLDLGIGPYEHLIEPDYSLTPEQVCELVVVSSIDRTGKLEFLSHVPGERKPGLPSFVPDWTETSAKPRKYLYRLHMTDAFSASDDMVAEFTMTPGKCKLQYLILCLR